MEVLQGVNWVDYDGDLDVLLIGYRYNGNLVYKNIGNGQYEQLTNHKLMEGTGTGRSCACGDANNDGLPEIFVGNAREPNFYYENQGNWVFDKVSEGKIVEDLGYAYGASWVDYDGDLDLFLANFDKENFLFINDGKDHFQAITEGELALEKGGTPKGHSWVDYDNDGDLDLYIGNGTYKPDMRNFIYLNGGNSKFSDIRKEYLMFMQTPQLE